jgi:hypothetical protein
LEGLELLLLSSTSEEVYTMIQDVADIGELFITSLPIIFKTDPLGPYLPQ